MFYFDFQIARWEKEFSRKTKFQNKISQGRTPGKENMMITIEYAVKVDETEEIELLTNVDQTLFEQTLFVLLRCGYIIKNITRMKQ